MAYPSSLDSFTDPAGTSLLTSPDHAALHTSINGAVESLESKLGLAAGSPTANKALIGSGNGTSGWTTTWNSAVLGTPTITAGIWTSGSINSAIVGTPTVTGGTINLAVLGSPTLQSPSITGGTLAVSGTTVALSIGAAFVPTGGSLTDSASGTHTVNAQAAQVYYSVMGTAAGNRTIGTPNNPTAWQSLTYAFKASGSANGTLVWSGAFVMSQDVGTPTLGTGTTWNYYSWRYNSVESKWHYQGQSSNIV